MSRYVLTIQSHVAYGFVGNSAAVFPLQLLGFSPIVVNTVEFSNHTGHPTFRGQVFTAELIRDIYSRHSGTRSHTQDRRAAFRIFG